MQIIRELRKRKVFTTAAIYLPIAWIVTEVLTFLFEKFPVPAWADELIAAIFVAGFPAAMILAWTFDLGPNGLTRTKANKAQGLVTIVCAALLMAGGTAGLFYLIKPNVPELNEVSVVIDPAANSIAVYPFENLSSDPEDAYFSDGMTIELITRLSQIKGLHIAGIAQTKQQTLSLGVEPEVRYRLEGTVRRSGDKVRITALLVDRASSFTVWSNIFDSELQDVFEFQEQTALHIAEALDVRLSAEEQSAVARHHTVNPAAYDAFLRGWSLIESFHVNFDLPGEKLEAARAHFQTALSIEPAYARAVAGLAMVESYAVFLKVEPAANRNLAQELASQAIALDDSLPETHFAMARALSSSKDYSGAAAAFHKVLELDSQNGYAWCELAGVLNFQDPADPVGAELAAREGIRFRPAYSTAYFNLGAALQQQQRLREAADAYQQSLQLNPADQGLQRTLGQLYLELGDYIEALARFEILEPTPELLIQISVAHQALGNSQDALKALEQAVAAGYRDFAAVEANPQLAGLVDEPRYRKLIEQILKPLEAN